ESLVVVAGDRIDLATATVLAIGLVVLHVVVLLWSRSGRRLGRGSDSGTLGPGAHPLGQGVTRTSSALPVTVDPVQGNAEPGGLIEEGVLRVGRQRITDPGDVAGRQRQPVARVRAVGGCPHTRATALEAVPV